jgi:hypothetical protein
MSKYENPLDVYIFKNPEDITESDCKLIVDALHRSDQCFDVAILRSYTNAYYSFNFEAVSKFGITGDSKFGKLLKERNEILQSKNIREIINMTKTEEEACLWVDFFFVQNYVQAAYEIRKQITTMNNRLLNDYDVKMEILCLHNKSGKEFFDEMTKITKRYETILASDPILQILDPNPQKIKEIIIFILIKMRGRFLINLGHKARGENFPIVEFIKNYYDFVHRDERKREKIESNFLSNKVDIALHMKKQIELLKSNRTYACMTEIINLWDMRRPMIELIEIIHENFDKVVGMSKLPLGCAVLDRLVLKLKEEKGSAIELLVSRIVRLTMNRILDKIYVRQKFVIKIYDRAIHAAECPVCFDEFEPERTTLIQCRTCQIVVCIKCYINIRRVICPVCRTVEDQNGVGRLLMTDFIIPDFKHELPPRLE